MHLMIPDFYFGVRTDICQHCNHTLFLLLVCHICNTKILNNTSFRLSLLKTYLVLPFRSIWKYVICVVFIVDAMKHTIFWDAMLCNLTEVYLLGYDTVKSDRCLSKHQ